MRRFSRLPVAVAVALALALAGAGCAGAGGDRVVRVNRTFPLPARSDLVVRLAPDAPRPAVRAIVTGLTGTGGVQAAEAHYDLGEVRLAVSQDMSPANRRRLADRLREHSEVVSVDLYAPEE